MACLPMALQPTSAPCAVTVAGLSPGHRPSGRLGTATLVFISPTRLSYTNQSIRRTLLPLLSMVFFKASERFLAGECHWCDSHREWPGPGPEVCATVPRAATHTIRPDQSDRSFMGISEGSRRTCIWGREILALDKIGLDLGISWPKSRSMH